MKIITMNDIKKAKIDYYQYLSWIDYPLRHREDFVFPTKSRITLNGSNYCNLMPCALPSEDILGIKIINRNEKRRQLGRLNLDSQVLLYSYNTCELKAVMDGNYITTVRTAAVAVHTIMNMVNDYEVVSLVGLGNIMCAIGEMWFPTIKKKTIIKLIEYKNQAERFIERFSNYDLIEFRICKSYDDLMRDSDLILSAVSYIENDFCSYTIYKKGCTIIPIHLRGFMECDKHFDNIVVSDLIRARGFTYYDQMKRVTYTDDILNKKEEVRKNKDDRVIIYNLGLAITDLVFAEHIYREINNKDDIVLGTNKKFYFSNR